MQTICKCRIPQFLIGFMICHGLAGFIFSGVVPGRWEKLAAEPIGAEIRIVFRSGEHLEATIQEVAADHIRVLTGDARQILAQKSDIIRIISGRRHDRVRNGALTGATIGGGIRRTFFDLLPIGIGDKRHRCLGDRRRGYYDRVRLWPLYRGRH